MSKTKSNNPMNVDNTLFGRLFADAEVKEKFVAKSNWKKVSEKVEAIPDSYVDSITSCKVIETTKDDKTRKLICISVSCTTSGNGSKKGSKEKTIWCSLDFSTRDKYKHLDVIDPLDIGFYELQHVSDIDKKTGKLRTMILATVIDD